MSDEKVAEALNNALDNPPFDPPGLATSDAKPQYTIKVKQLGEYPDSGQPVDSSAWALSNLGCPPEPGFWASLFGPTKADLRREIERLKDERDKNLTTYAADLWELRRQVSNLQKSNNDYRFSLKRANERVQEVNAENARFRHELAVANEEIMRLTPAPKKRGRPKKAK